MSAEGGGEIGDAGLHAVVIPSADDVEGGVVALVGHRGAALRALGG